MSGAAPGPRGLSAAELGAVVGELQALIGSAVVDVAGFATAPGPDDLLLVLQMPSGADRTAKAFLHVALGGPRSRVTTTARRFAKAAFARSGSLDLVLRELAGARLSHVGHTPNERRCAMQFTTARGDRRLLLELFGSRGLWTLLDAEGTVMAMSREVATAVRALKPGDRYAAPPPGASGPHEAECRFDAPVLAAVDDHFTRLDLANEQAQEHEALVRAARKALHRMRAKVDGIGQQLADTERSARLRQQADLMLAFAHSVPRGAASMTFADPTTNELRTIDLDPAKTVVQQAQAVYEQARRLDDGRAIAERRHAEAGATVASLERALVLLEPVAATADAAPAGLAEARALLETLGVVPRPPKPAAPAGQSERRAAPGENFRRFVSAEGYPILVGRNNEQNDRLTMRTANGNDLWLHVGGGRPGSHVVVRLPKQKTASLETLLDAAALAVHFSKARGEPRIDVVYTQRKHVRKPKGLPAGAVVPSQTRTITSLLDPTRLARLLDSAGADDAD